MSLYDQPYHDPNTITFKIPNMIANEPEQECTIFRYDWDGFSTISPYKDKIEAKFERLNTRILETICIYVQYQFWFNQPDWTDMSTYPAMDDWILEKIWRKYADGVDRIKLVGYEKYYNPVSNYIEYKLEDGTYVRTDEQVTPTSLSKIKVSDFLKILDDKKFVKDCMPKENRNAKIKELLESTD